MHSTTEPQNYKQLYNMVDWLDFGLVIAIVIYYSRLASNVGLEQIFDLSAEHASPIGIALLLASLAIAITFIYLTVKMRKLRQVSIARATVRIIWNAIWIPLDAYFLYMILF